MPRKKSVKAAAPRARKAAVAEKPKSAQEDDFAPVQEYQAGPALKWADVECPYCGESFEVRVDPSEDGQSMVQDCQVCCKPIQMSVEIDEEDVSVYADRA